MNKAISVVAGAIILLLLAADLDAQTSLPAATPVVAQELATCVEVNQEAELFEGELTYIGTEPFSDLVLVSGEDRDGEVYLVTGDLLNELEGFYAERVQICAVSQPSEELTELEVLEYVPLSLQPTPSPTPTEQPRPDLTSEH